jgi:hypothetical protein
MLDTGPYEIQTIMRNSNWMQALEGDIDTVHSEYLHSGSVDYRQYPKGSGMYYRMRTQGPRYAVTDTEAGTSYGAYKQAEEDLVYWRIAHFLFPFYTMIPTDVLGEAVRIRAWVPIDSSHTMVWSMNAPRVPSAQQGNFYGKAFGDGNRGQNFNGRNRGGGAGGNEYLPDTSDWLGKFRLVANKGNDYLIDRDLQASKQSYTGMKGLGTQDCAIQESMGPISDRSLEHLLPSDAAIVKIRKLLLQTLKDHADGKPLPGMKPESYRVRSARVELPKGTPIAEAAERAVRLDTPVAAE